MPLALDDRMLEIDPRSADLNHRWRAARRAAIVGVTGAVAAEDAAPDAAPESPWVLALALSAGREGLLRQVYDNGLRLGRSFARFHGGPVPADALGALLAGLDGPCLRGRLCRDPALGGAQVLDRPPCAVVETGTCDYWREAIAGLVHGLTDGLHFARHDSAGRGGRRCRDVVSAQADGPGRLAALDDEESAALAAATVALRLLAPGVTLHFEGRLEDAIAYRRAGDGCGPAAPTLEGQGAPIDEVLGRFLPGRTFKDTSPRAVLAPTAREAAS